MAEPHLQDKTSPSPSEKSNVSLLSLPDELISRMFTRISPNKKYTLQSSIDALNLASANKRLHRIFSTQLKKITPILDHLNADTLSEQHLAALINHAGANLRELHVPSYTHRYVPILPNICPNIEVLHMFNIGGHQYSSNNTDKHSNDMSHMVSMLPRLKLRKLTITAPPNELFNVLGNRMPEELHLYKMMDTSLPLLLPLLSHPLKALTVTTIGLGRDYEIFNDFIDSLCEAVPNIQSLTIHEGPKSALALLAQNPLGNPPAVFKDNIAAFITSVRESNQTSSKCTSIDIRGIESLRLLAAVNKKAVITVSEQSLTLRDEVSTGTYIMSLALDNFHSNQDVTRLERAFLLQPGEGPAYWTNPLWNNRLKDHKLRVVRAYVAEALMHLKLSTEILELSACILPDVTDWSLLSGVRELYLLDTVSLYRRWGDYEDEISVLKALPSMVDAFHGDLIWIENMLGGSCSSGPGALQMMQHRLRAVEAVNRFIMRGGDAATLQNWLG